MSQDLQPSDKRNYNKVFERIQERCRAKPDIVQALAYAYYKGEKAKWIQDHWSKNNRPPEQAEFAGHEAAMTDGMLDAQIERAEAALAKFGDAMILKSRPEIQEQAVKGMFWWNVWASVVGSLIFAVILTVLGILLVKLGIPIPIQFKTE